MHRLRVSHFTEFSSKVFLRLKNIKKQNFVEWIEWMWVLMSAHGSERVIEAAGAAIHQKKMETDL